MYIYNILYIYSLFTINNSRTVISTIYISREGKQINTFITNVTEFNRDQQKQHSRNQ